MAAVIAAVGSSTAYAQSNTSTGTLNVQATVASACSVANAALSFGPINPIAGAALAVNTNILVTCTQGTTFQVALGDGANASSGQRRMKGTNTGSFLSYELYQDAAGATRFGDAVNGQRVLNQSGLGTVANSIPVHASVLSGQNSPADAYADNVQIKIYY